MHNKNHYQVKRNRVIKELKLKEVENQKQINKYNHHYGMNFNKINLKTYSINKWRIKNLYKVKKNH